MTLHRLQSRGERKGKVEEFHDIVSSSQMPYPGYAPPTQQPPHPNQEVGLTYENEGKIQNRIVLTQDEMRVIKECNVESFYYRCIPLATLFSGLAYLGMKNGYLVKNLKYGYLPKMGAGVLIGYIFGKFTYQNVCAEKILKLENSPLAERLRKRKGGLGFQESLSLDKGFSVTRGNEPERDSALFDQRNPDLSDHNDGSDSYDRVTESLSPYTSVEEGKRSPESYITYDELRRANREEYLSKMMEKYKKPESSLTPEPPFSPEISPSTPYEPTERPPSQPTPSRPYFDKQKNKYGDIWDD